MNRRAFLAALFAPFFRRFLPKPKPKLVVEDLGISIRLIRSFDGSCSRMDVLYGFGIIRPEYSVRIIE